MNERGRDAFEQRGVEGKRPLARAFIHFVAFSYCDCNFRTLVVVPIERAGFGVFFGGGEGVVCMIDRSILCCSFLWLCC